MNLTAIKTLTAMGILSDDENLIDAALAELLDMPAEQRQELDPSDDVDYLLIHYNLGKVSLQQQFD
jgi:superkiller protein 3